MKKGLTMIITVCVSMMLISCQNTPYVDYMENFTGYEETIGLNTNDESFSEMSEIYEDPTALDINVLPVNLKDDFIIGVDISSILDVEKNGGKFYNDEGFEQDVFEILKEKGVNYIRLRLWNEPYSENNLPYGGGNNHIETNIEIAKRAARVGMRFLLDFHYSDFWADPAKQLIPRAWKDLTEIELEQKMYEYTFNVLKQFEQAGVRPHMVQIGNEINNGFLFPVAPVSKGYGRIAKFLKQGLKAVKDVSEDILTSIHLAKGASEQELVYFYDKLNENEVEFDVIGLSYYSFWHGNLQTFKSTLEALNNRYDQSIVVMEYSYGFTDKEAMNASHIYSSDLEDEGGYGTSFQGQASYIRDVNEAINGIDSGIGSFYWEPAWLPVANAGWASNGAIDYLTKQGDDVTSINKVSWANQALFTFSGKASPVLNVFNDMKTSNFDGEIVIDYESELNMVLNIRADESLPSVTTAYTSLDRRTTLDVTWNQSQIDMMLLNGAGVYDIEGTIKSGMDTLPVVIHINAYENYVNNASFESGGRVSTDVKDFSLVDAWSVVQSIDGTVKVESKNARKDDNNGFNNLNIYQTSAYTFELFQTINLTPGTYRLAIWSRSDTTNGIAKPNVELFASFNNQILDKTAVLYGPSWSIWQQTILEFTLINSGDIKIGIMGNGVGSSWAHFDDFTLEKIG